MKQCPKCSRVYADETLNFCLDDGEWLLADDDSADAPTAIISGSESNPGQPTQTLPGSGESTVIHTPAGDPNGVIRRNKTPIIIAVGILILAGLVIGLVKFYRPHISSASNAPLKVTPLTSSPGIERDPAFSPDGKQVAFVWTGENDDNFDIYVKIVGAGEPLRLTTDPGRDMSPAWSPDGRFIAFVRGTTEKKGVYIISALGGAERKVTDVAEWKQNGTRPQSLNWSPDGKTLALIDKNSEDDPWAVFLVSVDTGERKQLTQPPAGFSDGYLCLSPDGTRIAFVRAQSISGYVYTVPITGGEPTKVTPDEGGIFGLAWTADGTELLYGFDRSGADPTMWRIPAAGGTPSPIAGVGDYVHEISASRQGDRIAYARADVDQNIYRLEMSRGSNRNISLGSSSSFISSTRMEMSPRYSPDGNHIAFLSDRSGAGEIWLCDTDGKNLVQLTNAGSVHILGASWSPDSRFIAYAAPVNGDEDVYIVGADGGSPRRLTNNAAPDVGPSWSHDGRWIYFTSKRTGRSEVWKMPSAGGDAVQVTHGGGTNPQESPDGRTVYYIKGELQTRRRSEPGLWQVSTDGGDETRLFDLRVDGGNWVVMPRGIYFLAYELGQTPYMLEFFDFTTRQTTQIKTLDGPRSTFNITGMTVSPDEKWVAYGQRDKLSFDLMLVENFH